MTRTPVQLVKDGRPAAIEDLSDDDLMVLARSDRQDAFAALVGRHQRLVLGLATRYLGDVVAGRDVAQDVFLALWAERARYRPKGRFSSYLVSMTMHRCHHVARRRRTRAQKLSDLSAGPAAETPVPPELPVDVLVEQERAKEVRDKLTELPDKCRQVLILRYTHEMSLEEVGSHTGMPVGTVKSHVFRGLKRLARLLTKGA